MTAKYKIPFVGVVCALACQAWTPSSLSPHAATNTRKSNPSISALAAGIDKNDGDKRFSLMPDNAGDLSPPPRASRRRTEDNRQPTPDFSSTRPASERRTENASPPMSEVFSTRVKTEERTENVGSTLSMISDISGKVAGAVTNVVLDKAQKQDTSELIHDFCVGTNTFWKGLAVPPFQNYVQIRPAGFSKPDILSKLIAPPELPGIPRPVWLTILGSVPTGLGWYGYYKFSVEEELYQYELATEGKVTGCGGYGTLLPFVFGIIIGLPLQYIHFPAGDVILQASGLWILLGQVNLYRRVNELCEDAKEGLGLSEGPLKEWWALLPPPLDVVVGLRQVHFLSEYWRLKRGEPYEKDVIAEELFPFISERRNFTLKEFFRTPSIWFWFTRDWADFEFDFLKD